MLNLNNNQKESNNQLHKHLNINYSTEIILVNY